MIRMFIAAIMKDMEKGITAEKTSMDAQDMDADISISLLIIGFHSLKYDTSKVDR